MSQVEWEKRLSDKLRESVSVRLNSDVPFGAFLSGGIDSSLVVAYMAELLDYPVNTFTIGFREANFSELEYAETVATRFSTRHHQEILTPEATDLLPKLVRHYGQPFADSSAIPTYYVSASASKHVKMVLSGDGGDEVFAGYNTYSGIITRSLDVDAKRKKLVGSSMFARLCKWFIADNTGLDELAVIQAQFYQHFSLDERQKLFTNRFREFIQDDLQDRMAILSRREWPLISRLQKVDMVTYLPFDILTKVDIASMANSLEVRSPLLDHELMEMAATVPADMKFKFKSANGDLQESKKYILKCMATKWFNRSFFERPKQGFGIPLGNWFAGKLKDEISNRLLKSDYLGIFFERKYIKSLLESHTIDHDLSARIWNLLFLEEWLSSHSEVLSDI